MSYIATIIASIALAVSGWFGVHTETKPLIVGANSTISNLTSLSTPADADSMAIVDTTAIPATTKKLTWANLKATTKAYFDGIYPQATGSTTITTLGTITTGTWNGTAIPVAYGGTGTTSPTSNQVMIGNGTSGFKVIGFGTSGQFLTSAGAGTAPTWTTSSVALSQDNTWTGANTFNTATTTFNVPVVFNSVTTGIKQNQYGSSTDSSVVFDGTSVVLGLTPSSNTYTLTRDIQAINFIVNNGVTINTAGYVIYSSGMFSNAGTIKNDGSTGTAGGNGGVASAGSGGSGGAGGAGGTLGGGVAGVSGGNGTTAGAGGAGTAGTANTGIGSAGSAGGASGSCPGSGQPAASGGAAGTLTSETLTVTFPLTTNATTSSGVVSGTSGGTTEVGATTTPNNKSYATGSVNGKAFGTNSGSGGGGGAPGLGGANGGGGGGGGSGGSGGNIAIFAYVFTNTGTIETIGGVGGAGGNSLGGLDYTGGAGGGGAGGAGGNIILVYSSYSNSGTINVSGGNGGVGGTAGVANITSGNNGVAGTNGVSGKIFRVKHII